MSLDLSFFKIFNNVCNFTFSSWRKINTTVDTVSQEALKIIAMIVSTGLKLTNKALYLAFLRRTQKID